jgi:arsenate reductase (glutaredoxin)
MTRRVSYFRRTETRPEPSCANPAVAIAHSFIAVFSGIRPLRCIRGTVLLPRDLQMTITIYHNPSCGTSRNTLAMIRQSGVEPTIIEYLKKPPARLKLIELLAAMRMSARALLREKGTPYAELGLADSKWSDDELIDVMLAHPILINRPIVVTPDGVKLCRPSEAVLDILPNPHIGRFVKEDGEVIEAL